MKLRRILFGAGVSAVLVLIWNGPFASRFSAGAGRDPSFSNLDKPGGRRASLSSYGKKSAGAPEEAGGEMRQYRAGGHVLGFSAEGVLIAAGSHVLKLGFPESGRAQPDFDGGGGSEKRIASPMTEAPLLTEVEYPGIWKGITLRYERHPGGVVKSTYEISAGADPNSIKSRSNIPVEVDQSGFLHYLFETGEMVESKPVAWQEIDGQRVDVGVDYVKCGDREIGFLEEDYNRNYSLKIDLVLSWNTFLGGSDDDYGESIAVDSSGNIYVAGSSTGTWGSPISSYGGGESDAFAAKLNPNGVLQWSTFLGGSSRDEGKSIAVDGSGNAYIVGSSNMSWGSPIRPFGGDADAFSVKLNSSGVRQWSTFLGGSGGDYGNCISVDVSGDAYIAGSSNTSWGSPIRPYGGDGDAFTVKLNSSGVLQWNSFLGGSGRDYGNCISVDGSGNVCVAGNSHEPSWGNPISPHSGRYYDVFAAKLDSNGSLQWNTYLWGGDWDYDNCMGIAVDGLGNVFMAGDSRVVWENPKMPPPRQSAGFAAKLNSSGVFQWNTDLVGADLGYGIAVDDSGNAYVVGSSAPDAYITKLNSSGVPQWKAYLGGSWWDEGRGIAADGSGNIYVAGLGATTWGSPMNPYGGGYDAFTVKIPQVPSITVTSPNGGETWAGGSTHPLAWTTTGMVANVKLEYSTNNGTDWTTIIASTPDVDSFAWTVPPVVSADCLVRIREAASGFPMDSSDAVFAIVITAPVIGLSKTSFNFGSERYGTPTPAETAAIANCGIGTLIWTAIPSEDWLSVSPGSGLGSGVLTIGIARTDMPPGSYAGTVAVSDPNAPNSPQMISVGLHLRPVGTDSPPFGNFETPADGATVDSSIPVTGWVLDDIAVRFVRIYRGTGLADRLYIGDAVFSKGARPDVEAAYPEYPQNDRAGWGYMLLTNVLPNGGNGTFQLLAYATDNGGHDVLLGNKVITCDNLHAVKPFGVIDTPEQGGTASGNSYINFGWALTPLPKSIPIDGSTITVWMDGMPLGHPTYNNFRSDIATLFPEYANANGAVGYYFLDTTGYENRVHTIAWSVADSAGAVDGIGSRYFTIQNVAGGSVAHQNVGIRSAAEIAGIPEDIRTPVNVKRGYRKDQPTETVFPDINGSIRIRIPEVSRVAVYLNENKIPERDVEKKDRGRRLLLNSAAKSLDETGYEAYELVLGQLRPLPIGASFDSRDGVFSWQPGPGFLGEFTIVFLKKEPGSSTLKIITIEIGK